MKSNRAFFILIVFYLITLYLISIFVHYDIDHSQQKPIIIPIANAILGIVIMGLTLTKNNFILFIILYGCLWVIIGLLTLMAYFFPVISISSHTIHTIHFANIFSKSVFLDTPLPFIFYWVFIKANNYIK